MTSILTEGQKKKYKKITGKDEPSFKEVIKSLSRPEAERKREMRWLKKDRTEDLNRIIRRAEKEAAAKKQSMKRGKPAR